MIVQVAHATVTFDPIDPHKDMWMLGFEDHVQRQRGGQTQLIPTGLTVQVGPMSRELAEKMARSMLAELSGVVVPSNGGPS